jgi:hypothetical protein
VQPSLQRFKLLIFILGIHPNDHLQIDEQLLEIRPNIFAIPQANILVFNSPQSAQYTTTVGRIQMAAGAANANMPKAIDFPHQSQKGTVNGRRGSSRISLPKLASRPTSK